MLAVSIVLLIDGPYGEVASVGLSRRLHRMGCARRRAALRLPRRGADRAPSLISDLRSGYLDRLRLLSISPAAMIAGLAGMLALASALAVAWNGIFYLAALVTVNPAVIQGLAPLTFMPAVMFSSFWVPEALMPDWYRWTSDHNPVTPIIDAGRSIMLGTTDWDRLAVSAAVLAILSAMTYSLAGRRLTQLLRVR